MATAHSINILIVIDTEYIKKTYGHGSLDKDKPTSINHSSQRMIVTGDRGIISGQGTADLNFKAAPGDYVAFAGTSIYDNSDDAIIVYGIIHGSGDENVFGQFSANLVTRNKAVMPIRTGDGLPPKQIPLTFATYESRVSQSGTENFLVYIALYVLDITGQKQELYGYYCWDPTITVDE